MSIFGWKKRNVELSNGRTIHYEGNGQTAITSLNIPEFNSKGILTALHKDVEENSNTLALSFQWENRDWKMHKICFFNKESSDAYIADNTKEKYILDWRPNHIIGRKGQNQAILPLTVEVCNKIISDIKTVTYIALFYHRNDKESNDPIM